MGGRRTRGSSVRWSTVCLSQANGTVGLAVLAEERRHLEAVEGRTAVGDGDARDRVRVVDFTGDALVAPGDTRAHQAYVKERVQSAMQSRQEVPETKCPGTWATQAAGSKQAGGLRSYT